jgi:hypothetical protein
VSQISCPKCNDLAEQGGYAAWQWIVSICFFPIGLLALLAGRQPSTCKNCGYAWKAGIAPPVVIETRQIVAPTSSSAPSPARKDIHAELLKLDELRSKGLLTEAEFSEQKRRLLS